MYYYQHDRESAHEQRRLVFEAAWPLRLPGLRGCLSLCEALAFTKASLHTYITKKRKYTQFMFRLSSVKTKLERYAA